MVKTLTVYEGDLHCSVTHGPSGRVLETDAPVDNQGRGESFSPTDLMGVALGSCMATTMGIKARQMGIALEGMRVEVIKEMSADAPRRIAKLTAEIWLPCRARRIRRGSLRRRRMGAGCIGVCTRKWRSRWCFTGQGRRERELADRGE